jgi:hypothetical protein
MMFGLRPELRAADLHALFFWGFFVVVLAVLSFVYKQPSAAHRLAHAGQPLLLLEDQRHLRRPIVLQHRDGPLHREGQRRHAG